MMDYGLGRVQQAESLILNEVDRICKKNDIQYFLWGGTMIGAVRHNGFIPWDYDIDIVMKLKDYNKFIALAPQELGDDFELFTPGQAKGMESFNSHVLYRKSGSKNPTDEEIFYGKVYNRVHLDLFCMVDACEGLMFKLQTFRIKMIYGYCIAHRYRVDYSKYSFFGKIAAKVLRCIGKHYSPTEIMEKLRKTGNWGSDSSKKYRIINDQIAALYRGYDKVWFDEIIQHSFADGEYPIPKGYDECLTYIYGDYMQLPPEEERCTSDIFTEFDDLAAAHS